MDDIDLYSSKGMTCPHCMHINRDDLWEYEGAYNGGDGEATCGSCGKDFKWESLVSHAWQTEKLDVSNEK